MHTCRAPVPTQYARNWPCPEKRLNQILTPFHQSTRYRSQRVCGSSDGRTTKDIIIDWKISNLSLRAEETWPRAVQGCRLEQRWQKEPFYKHSGPYYCARPAILVALRRSVVLLQFAVRCIRVLFLASHSLLHISLIRRSWEGGCLKGKPLQAMGASECHLSFLRLRVDTAVNLDNGLECFEAWA